MEAIVVTWRELLVVVVLVLAVYIAEMLLMMRAGGALRKPRWLSMIQEKTVEAELRQQIETLTKRVAIIETGIALKASLPTQPLSTSEFDWSVTPTPPVQPVLPVEIPEQVVESENAYQRAVKMAQGGADTDTLVEECGISHSEAELIVSMHKR